MRSGFQLISEIFLLIEGKESFIEAGGENFDMIPCLNDNDDHIFLLKSLIQRSI